jgi:hypothetical protein
VTGNRKTKIETRNSKLAAILEFRFSNFGPYWLVTRDWSRKVFQEIIS